MKKLILVALALVTISVSGQERRDHNKKMDKKERAERMSEYTPEEIAELQTKQMTLQLDLTEAQQKKMMALNVENAEYRKAVMEKRKETKESADSKKPSKEEQLKMKNDMLDRKIAVKKQMKEILNEEQYQKWEAMAKEKMEKGMRQKKDMKHRK